ncbi:MAG: dihydropteroate synthase [Thermodesulfobacteriota bacterium]|nr:dihydropteroate synthase [Thermodesulfobacteriota bacterium]
MILVGENLNVMSNTYGPAMKAREPKVIQDLVKEQEAAGVDYIDLNIGPARKAGDELMEWLVKVVQEVTDLPLALDTTNYLAIEAGLAAHKGKALINSISLQPERLENMLPMVKKYNADMIGLLWGVGGMPRDANERAMFAVDLVYNANEAGVANEEIWIDPIATPISVEINQVLSCLEFMSMLADIAPGCKSIVGLSNVSNGTPTHLRPYLNRTYMVMLMKCGLYSAIVDAFDEELVKLAKGQMNNIVELIYRVMDGESIDTSQLSPKEVEYVKTTEVLLGKSLYSHSWLEV